MLSRIGRRYVLPEKLGPMRASCEMQLGSTATAIRSGRQITLKRYHPRFSYFELFNGVIIVLSADLDTLVSANLDIVCLAKEVVCLIFD